MPRLCKAIALKDEEIKIHRTIRQIKFKTTSSKYTVTLVSGIQNLLHLVDDDDEKTTERRLKLDLSGGLAKAVLAMHWENVHHIYFNSAMNLLQAGLYREVALRKKKKLALAAKREGYFKKQANKKIIEAIQILIEAATTQDDDEIEGQDHISDFRDLGRPSTGFPLDDISVLRAENDGGPPLPSTTLLPANNTQADIRSYFSLGIPQMPDPTLNLTMDEPSAILGIQAPDELPSNIAEEPNVARSMDLTEAVPSVQGDLMPPRVELRTPTVQDMIPPVLEVQMTTVQDVIPPRVELRAPTDQDMIPPVLEVQVPTIQDETVPEPTFFHIMRPETIEVLHSPIEMDLTELPQDIINREKPRETMPCPLNLELPLRDLVSFMSDITIEETRQPSVQQAARRAHLADVDEINALSKAAEAVNETTVPETPDSDIHNLLEPVTQVILVHKKKDKLIIDKETQIHDYAARAVKLTNQQQLARNLMNATNFNLKKLKLTMSTNRLFRTPACSPLFESIRSGVLTEIYERHLITQEKPETQMERISSTAPISRRFTTGHQDVPIVPLLRTVIEKTVAVPQKEDHLEIRQAQRSEQSPVRPNVVDLQETEAIIVQQETLLANLLASEVDKEQNNAQRNVQSDKEQETHIVSRATDTALDVQKSRQLEEHIAVPFADENIQLEMVPQQNVASGINLIPLPVEQSEQPTRLVKEPETDIVLPIAPDKSHIIEQDRLGGNEQDNRNLVGNEIFPPTGLQDVPARVAQDISPEEVEVVLRRLMQDISPKGVQNVPSTGVEVVHPTGIQDVPSAGVEVVHPTGIQDVPSAGVEVVLPTGIQDVPSTGVEVVHPTVIQDVPSAGVEVVLPTGIQDVPSTGVEVVHPTGIQDVPSTGVEVVHPTVIQDVPFTGVEVVLPTVIHDIPYTRVEVALPTVMQDVPTYPEILPLRGEEIDINQQISEIRAVPDSRLTLDNPEFLNQGAPLLLTVPGEVPSALPVLEEPVPAVPREEAIWKRGVQSRCLPPRSKYRSMHYVLDILQTKWEVVDIITIADVLGTEYTRSNEIILIKTLLRLNEKWIVQLNKTYDTLCISPFPDNVTGYRG